MGYMGHDLILAPHIDDEVIGCFELLKYNVDACVDIIYFYDITDERKEAIPRLKNRFRLVNNVFFNNETITFTLNNVEDYLEKYDRIFCPDPIFETHPDHKELGNLGTYIFKNYDWFNGIIFYTVNMQAPYVRKLNEEEIEDKRNSLNEIYPDQKSLWESDYKYFLFEGSCKWLREHQD